MVVANKQEPPVQGWIGCVVDDNQERMEEYSLEEILPHRGTMLLIDAVTAVGEAYAVTESVVKESYPTADGRGVSPLVLVELAAQTAGICNSLGRIQKEGRGTKTKGWLVGVKRASFFVEDSIPLGSRLVVRSENRHEFDLLREVFCVVHLEETLVGEITLQLIQA